MNVLSAEGAFLWRVQNKLTPSLFTVSLFHPFWSEDIKRSMRRRVNRPRQSSLMSIELPSTHHRKDVTVIVCEKLASFAALAHGDGYAEYGEVRVVTANSIFRDALKDLVIMVAQEPDAMYRLSEKASAITTRRLGAFTTGL